MRLDFKKNFVDRPTSNRKERCIKSAVEKNNRVWWKNQHLCGSHRYLWKPQKVNCYKASTNRLCINRNKIAGDQQCNNVNYIG